MSDEQPESAPVVTKQQAARRRVKLPPAGDARREELRRRGDQLTQQAEQAPQLEGGAIDPRKFNVDRELAARFNSLEVSNQVDGYVYCWVRFGKGVMDDVGRKRALRVRDAEGHLCPVWEVVRGDMPEARELLDVQGFRVLGDVLLMRCRQELYDAVQAYEAELRRRQQEGVNTTLRELGERHGVTVHTDLNDPVMKRALSHAHAQQVASNQVDRALREGTVPGLGVRGR